MRDLSGHAGGTVAAPPEHCHAFLAAVEGYPAWHPEVVRLVEVLERDERGMPNRIHTQLHAGLGPAARDFDLIMTVAAEDSSRVTLTRVPRASSDEERFEVDWRIEGADMSARVSLDLRARLSIPRLMPIGGFADSFAHGFVEAARRALSPL